MNSTALFKNVLENQFKIPRDIKQDIIYCQRALKAHIKVHQMVLDVYKSQANPDPIQKKRITDELETQIYEINAEQQFLLLRLRRIIDEFYKALTRKGIPLIPEMVNNLVSNELVPLINDNGVSIFPMNVRERHTEEKLIEKYFEVKTDKNDAPANNYYEILDSDDEEEQKKAAIQAKSSKQQQHHQQKQQLKQDLQQQSSRIVGSNSQIDMQQTSLLKPLSQRIQHRDQYIDASQFVEVTDDMPSTSQRGIKNNSSTTSTNYKRKQNMSAFHNADASITIEKEQREESAVSKNVKMSRMNLRQALKKAQTETMAAKAAANSSTTMPVPVSLIQAVPKSNEPMPNKKYEGRGRPPRNFNAATNLPAMTTVKPIEVNSSSDDSTPERSITPQQVTTTSFPNEKIETRTIPEEFGQEIFLRFFGLFTPEMHAQMQQRRSKRKRRNVQNNERSDYHYGRIEYGSNPPTEDKKRRKDFLLSPQVKQRLQAKRPKRRSVEKSDETPTTTSRSGSSSPDEKRGCNECLKGGGSLDKCEECKAFYHAACHREVDSSTSKALSLNKIKICPACKRQKERQIKNETKQFENLQSTAKELEQKMAAEKTRRASLQQESEMYKIQMNKLYNIVKAIKSDQENSSD